MISFHPVSLETASASFLAKAGVVCDYTPIVSTATNLTILFMKCVILPFMTASFIARNHTLTWVKEKSAWNCIVLLVPVLGNIVQAIIFYKVKWEHESLQRAQQDLLQKIASDPVEVLAKPNPQLMDDESFVLQLLQAGNHNPLIIAHLSARLKKNPDFMLRALAASRYDPQILAHASDSLKGDRDFMLQVLAATDYSLQILAHAGDSLKNNQAFALRVLVATAYRPQVLAQMGSQLKGDRAFMLGLLKDTNDDPEILAQASDELRNEAQFMIQVLESSEYDPAILAHAGANLKNDEPFMLRVLAIGSHKHELLAHASETLRSCEAFMLQILAFDISWSLRKGLDTEGRLPLDHLEIDERLAQQVSRTIQRGPASKSPESLGLARVRSRTDYDRRTQSETLRPTSTSVYRAPSGSIAARSSTLASAPADSSTLSDEVRAQQALFAPFYETLEEITSAAQSLARLASDDRLGFRHRLQLLARLQEIVNGPLWQAYDQYDRFWKAAQKGALAVALEKLAPWQEHLRATLDEANKLSKTLHPSEESFFLHEETQAIIEQLERLKSAGAEQGIDLLTPLVQEVGQLIEATEQLAKVAHLLSTLPSEQHSQFTQLVQNRLERYRQARHSRDETDAARAASPQVAPIPLPLSPVDEVVEGDASAPMATATIASAPSSSPRASTLLAAPSQATPAEPALLAAAIPVGAVSLLPADEASLAASATTQVMRVEPLKAIDAPLQAKPTDPPKTGSASPLQRQPDSSLNVGATPAQAQPQEESFVARRIRELQAQAQGVQLPLGPGTFGRY